MFLGRKGHGLQLLVNHQINLVAIYMMLCVQVKGYLKHRRITRNKKAKPCAILFDIFCPAQMMHDADDDHVLDALIQPMYDIVSNQTGLGPDLCLRLHRLYQWMQGRTHTGRSWASTAHRVVERLIIDLLKRHSKGEAIAVAGGLGLNNRLNTAIWQALKVPVHVPASPGDAGSSIGLLWTIQPPSSVPSPYVRGPARNHADVTSFGRAHGILGSPDLVEKYLMIGAVGFFRGRRAVGPSSLGMNSILWLPSQAVPSRADTLMIPQDRAMDVLNISSALTAPYGGFYARLRPHVASRLGIYSDVAVQTMSRENDEVLYQLLHSIHNTSQGLVPGLFYRNSPHSCVCDSLAEVGHSLACVVLDQYLFAKTDSEVLGECRTLCL